MSRSEKWKVYVSARARKDLFKVACEKVDDILANHEPKPVDADVKKAIREIVKKADKELYTAY